MKPLNEREIAAQLGDGALAMFDDGLPLKFLRARSIDLTARRTKTKILSASESSQGGEVERE